MSHDDVNPAVLKDKTGAIESNPSPKGEVKLVKHAGAVIHTLNYLIGIIDVIKHFDTINWGG